MPQSRVPDPSETIRQAHALALAHRHAQAEALCRRALSADPRSHALEHTLAQILIHRGDPAAAFPHASRAVDLAPRSAVYRITLGKSLILRGTPVQALPHLREAVRLMPNHPDPHAALGEALLRTGDADAAADSFLRGADLLPADPRTCRIYGEFCQSLKQTDAAVRAFQRWTSIAPRDVFAHTKLGEALAQKFDLRAAREAYLAAAAIEPSVGSHLAGAAEVSEHLNDLEAARDQAQRAYDLDNRSDAAAFVLARVKRRTGDLDGALQLLESHLSRGVGSGEIPGATRVELGHVLDALGRYDEAFAAVAAGKKAMGESAKARAIDVAAFPRLIEGYLALVTSGDAEAWPRTRPSPSREPPVFFVGFPRSGTTLTENILGAHPRLIASDERPFVRAMSDRMTSLFPSGASHAEALSALDEEKRSIIERAYWAAADRAFGADATRNRRILDKHPMAVCHLPLIRRIFPDAPVIVALRDPRDVVLSCFFQQFALNEANIHFLALESAADLYARAMSLWLACRDKLGLHWTETRYEDLIADVEGAARRLIAHIGEPWDDRILSFSDAVKDRTIRTASYAQVGQQLTNKSVARWKRYERHMQPLMPALEPFLRAFGYA